MCHLPIWNGLPHWSLLPLCLQFSLVEVFSSVQLLSHVRLFADPWTTSRQASLSITNSWTLLKLMSIKLVMPCYQLILCHPLLLLPSIFPRIRVFSNKSVLRIRWPKLWSFIFGISPSNVWQKPLQYCKVISLQLIKNKWRKKKNIQDWFSLGLKCMYVCMYLCMKSSLWYKRKSLEKIMSLL